MRFQIKTLFIVLLIAGFLAHVGECLRGYSLIKLFQVIHVFSAGLGVTIFLTVLCTSFLNRFGELVGLFLGILFWIVMLWFLIVFDGEIFRFVWINVMTMVFTVASVVYRSLQKPIENDNESHSVEHLKKSRQEKPVLKECCSRVYPWFQMY